MRQNHWYCKIFVGTARHLFENIIAPFVFTSSEVNSYLSRLWKYRLSTAQTDLQYDLLMVPNLHMWASNSYIISLLESSYQSIWLSYFSSSLFRLHVCFNSRKRSCKFVFPLFWKIWAYSLNLFWNKSMFSERNVFRIVWSFRIYRVFRK